MSRTSNLWMEEHERAVERFTTGQINSIEFVAALEKLGMEANDILDELHNDAEELRSAGALDTAELTALLTQVELELDHRERAAYAAEAAHYGDEQ